MQTSDLDFIGFCFFEKKDKWNCLFGYILILWRIYMVILQLFGKNKEVMQTLQFLDLVKKFVLSH